MRDEHYATVGQCLLWTLAAGLGEEFTAEVREAWIAAYGMLSGAMQRGAMAAADQATISFMTFPATSVSLKSRPL